jgi:hypothetical protein
VTDGAAYRPDPRTWPEQVATCIALARDRLRDLDSVLTRDVLAQAFLESTGLAAADPAALDAMRWIEARHLASEALGQLVADGEAWEVSSGEPPGVFQMWQLFGFENLGSFGVNAPEKVRPTVRLHSLDPATWVEPVSWPAVDALTLEAQGALRAGYTVAAAAAARVAVEQAVAEAFRTLAPGGGWKLQRAAQREAELFRLLPPGAFSAGPTDMRATQATLSASRQQGNDAAHDAKVPHPGVQALLSVLLPQALTSLHRAVQAVAG